MKTPRKIFKRNTLGGTIMDFVLTLSFVALIVITVGSTIIDGLDNANTVMIEDAVGESAIDKFDSTNSTNYFFRQSP